MGQSSRELADCSLKIIEDWSSVGHNVVSTEEMLILREKDTCCARTLLGAKYGVPFFVD